MRLLHQFPLDVRDHVEYVPVRELDGMDGNITDRSSLHVLADDVRRRGVLLPITIAHCPPTGITYICNGNHRLEVCRLLAYSTVPAVLRRVSVAEVQTRIEEGGFFLHGRRIPVTMRDFQGFARPSLIGISGTRPPLSLTAGSV